MTKKYNINSLLKDKAEIDEEYKKRIPRPPFREVHIELSVNLEIEGELVLNPEEAARLILFLKEFYLPEDVEDSEVNQENIERVRQNGMDLYGVNVQTREICLAAVRENGLALQYVREQTEEICLAAVNQDGMALVYVEHPTDKIQRAAFRQDPRALAFIS
jgi:hypothetical protein